ncbi:hypothetical protein CHUAL_007456 [Chamberlinius hualienensis]
MIAGKGLEFIRKMLLNVACVRDKLLLFDGQFNRQPSIVKNVYRLFLMVIFKMHSAFTRIPNPDRQNHQDNPEELLSIIVNCMKRVTKQIAQNKKNGQISCKLKLATVRWICLMAAIDKLSIHRNQYSKLLKCLKKLQTAEERNGKLNKNKRVKLRKITGKIPREFKTMKV